MTALPRGKVEDAGKENMSSRINHTIVSEFGDMPNPILVKEGRSFLGVQGYFSQI